MTEWVVDTNVPIVANGRVRGGERPPSLACRRSAIVFLQSLLEQNTILLDLAGEIQSEYRGYLRPDGQPGVGDRFYQVVLQSSPERIRRTELPRNEHGEYVDLPRSLIDANFDPSDRKFAALAKRERARIANSTDSDWVHHQEALRREGIELYHICGVDMSEWFS